MTRTACVRSVPDRAAPTLYDAGRSAMAETSVAIQRFISEACEEDLLKYGDSFRGAGYTKSPEEAKQRYALMLGVVREREESVSLLDFGCGLAHLLDYIEREPAWRRVRYAGLDLSPRYLAAARARHPEATLLLMDVLASDADLPDFDYIVLNGVFNYRGGIPESSMIRYWQDLTSLVFRHCRRGMAFNVMSRLVDWQRDDLFHLSFDTMAQFVGRALSRHFVIRHDYGAREYTTYVYRAPS
jgi:SAM-dependent methyltransferase